MVNAQSRETDGRIYASSTKQTERYIDGGESASDINRFWSAMRCRGLGADSAMWRSGATSALRERVTFFLAWRLGGKAGYRHTHHPDCCPTMSRQPIKGIFPKYTGRRGPCRRAIFDIDTHFGGGAMPVGFRELGINSGWSNYYTIDQSQESPLGYSRSSAATGQIDQKTEVPPSRHRRR